MRILGRIYQKSLRPYSATLSKNAKYNFILDNQSLQHLLKKKNSLSKTSGSFENMSFSI